MSLDERIRNELRDAVELGQLREDDALDDVWTKHRRGLIRKGIMRQAVAIAVALSLLASVAVVVSWRNVPDRFRSTTTLRIASASTSRAFPLADPHRLALAADTRRATLASAHLADDAPVDFQATFDAKRDLLTLAAVGPSALESRTVTHEWVSAFAKARRAEAVRVRRAFDRALNRRVRALHLRLRQIDAELKKIDPVYYAGLGRIPHPMPNGNSPRPSDPPWRVRENASTHELNLVNERVQLLAALAHLGVQATGRRIVPLEGPIVVAKPIAPAVRVDTASPATVPILVAWAFCLVVLLAGALLTYRRRARSTRQVSA